MRSQWPLLWPLLFMIGASVIIRWSDADRRLAGMFYDRDLARWTYETTQPWRWVYRKGPLPAVAFGLGAAVVAVFGRWLLPKSEWRQSRSFQRASLFLALLLMLGPGLLINVGLKQLWGRPRPNQCREFGGAADFVPVGDLPVKHLTNSSFPSGHASVAFYLMAPGFVISRRRPHWSAAFFIGGALFGLSMGLIRIVQGAHFPSDVLWSGALVYFTGVLLAKLILSQVTDSIIQSSELTTNPERSLG